MGKIIITGRLRNKFQINGQEINGCGINEVEKNFIVDLFKNQYKEIKYEVLGSISTHEKDFDDEYIRYAKAKVRYEKKCFEVKLSRKSYEEVVLIECKIEYEENNDDNHNNELFKSVYNFKIEMKKWFNNYCKPIYWLYDDDNALICSEGYKKIHTIENKFREVLSMYMMKKCGDIYLCNKLEARYKIYAGFYNSKYKDFKEINAKFYNLEFSDLSQILDIKSIQAIVDEDNNNSIDAIVKEISSILEKIKDISYDYNEIENLKKKMDSKLRSLEESDSIFDGSLLDILGVDFKKSWEQLSKMRNMVMHNKPICKKLFDDIKSYCDNFNEKFEKCFNYIESHFYSDEEGVYEALCDWEMEKNECYSEEIERLREQAGIEFSLNEDYVIDKLRENHKVIHDLITIFSNIEDLKKYVEQIYSNIDDIQEYMKNLNLEQVKKFITLINHDLNLQLQFEDEEYEDTYDIFAGFRDEILQNKGIEELHENIIYNTNLKDYFELTDVAKFFDCDNNKYEVAFDEELDAQNGATDFINCILYKNDEILKKACIKVYYGDYQLPDEGYIDSSQVNIINEEIYNINEKTKEYMETTIKITDKITKYIENCKID